MRRGRSHLPLSAAAASPRLRTEPWVPAAAACLCARHRTSHRAPSQCVNHAPDAIASELVAECRSRSQTCKSERRSARIDRKNFRPRSS